MGRYDDEIILLALGMAVGDRSEHMLCPACNGGGSKENSLLIWCDPGKIVARCYRVKCGFFAIVGETAPRAVTTKLRSRRTDASKLQPVPIPDDVSGWLQEKFPWLSHNTLLLNRIMWEDRLERILIPITSLSDTDEGYLTRMYPELCLDERNAAGPKCKAYFWPRIEDPTCLLVPRQRLANTLVLAEDWWSALRMAEHTPCIALSGTSIGERAWQSIMQAGVHHIVMVLDADAVAKASKLVQDYNLLFKSISLVPLSGADPKDMTDSAFETLMSQVMEQLP